MSIIYCHGCDHRYDSDFQEGCPRGCAEGLSDLPENGRCARGGEVNYDPKTSVLADLSESLRMRLEAFETALKYGDPDRIQTTAIRLQNAMDDLQGPVLKIASEAFTAGCAAFDHGLAQPFGPSLGEFVGEMVGGR